MEVTINIPSKLGEITLEQMQRFEAIDKTNDEFVMRKMLQIFCGVDDVLKVKLNDMMEVSEVLTNVFEEKPKLIKHFTLDGVKYGFIPSLTDMTFGEYADLTSYMNDFSQMHRVVAVCYRPITSETKEFYDIEEYKGTSGSEKFKKLNMEVVRGMQLFFYRIYTKLLNAGTIYLESQVKELTSQQEDNSTQDGDGMQHLQNLLMTMQQGLSKLPNYDTN